MSMNVPPMDMCIRVRNMRKGPQPASPALRCARAPSPSRAMEGGSEIHANWDLCFRAFDSSRLLTGS